MILADACAWSLGAVLLATRPAARAADETPELGFGLGAGRVSRGARIALVLFLAGLALRILVAWLPIEYLIESHATQLFLIDDSFISHGIARNLAQGRGMTFDGVHVTNGFQPLYVFLLVPLYRLVPHDPVLPIHLALTALAALNSLCGALLYRTVRLLGADAGALFGLAVWSFSPGVVRLGINGLETSLAALLLAWALYHHLAHLRLAATPRTRSFVVLGVLLGGAVLARIDSVLFAAAVAADLVLLGARRGRLREFVAGTALAGALALAVTSPWVALNLSQRGTLVPDSGRAVRFAALDRYAHEPPGGYYAQNLLRSVATLSDNPALPGFRSFRGLDYYKPEWWGLAVNLPLFIGLCTLAARGGKLGHLVFLLPYVCLMLCAYSFYVLGQWFYPRYYYAPMYVVVLVVSVALGSLYAGLPGRRLRATLAAALVLLLAVGFALEWRSIASRQSGCGYLQLARWIEVNTPPEAVVGAFQSGVLGYFLERKVVNLDGVVNPEALEALQRQEVFAYVKREGIDLIADAAWVVQVSLMQNSKNTPAQLRLLTRLCGGSVYQVL